MRTHLFNSPLSVVCLAVALLLPTTQEALAQSGPVLHGTVRAEGVRADGILPGALLELRQDDIRRTVVADARGRYRVEGLEPGELRISVFHLATEGLELTLRLPAEGETSLDLELESRVLALAPLVVEGFPQVGETGAGLVPVGDARVAVRLQTLEGSPGMVESGLAGVLGHLPGEDESAPPGVLYMRGSTVDARTVLLDGAPVMTPFHVAGLVSPFESDLLEEAQLFLGGAPSSYDGGLSYLLDVTTRTPRADAVQGSAALDGLLARASLESPLPGGGGLLVGGRTLHGLQSQLESGGDFPYDYRDLLLRWSLPLGEGHRLDYTGFFNRESVTLDEIFAQGGEAGWGNRVGSVRYRGATGRVGIRALAALSRYDSNLPLEWEESVMARGETEEDRVALEMVVPQDGWSLRVGGSADRVLYRYRLDTRGREVGTQLTEAPVEVGMSTAAAFGEVELPVSSRLRLQGGLRAHYFPGEAGLRVAPRGTATLRLTDDAALTASAGRYHEPIPLPGLVGSQMEGESATLGWRPQLPVASATHLVLSLDQRLDEEVELGVSGFVKAFDGLESNGLARMNASGTDLRISRHGERLGGWVGYALSWFWEETSPRAGGQGSSRFTGRHLVSAGLRGQWGDGMEAGLTVGYGAGLPLSAVSVADPWDGTTSPQTGQELSRPPVRTLTGTGTSPLEVAPEDDFLRLDLELAWVTEPTIGGRTTRLRPYLQVLNALNRRDALFHYFDRWRGGDVEPVAQRPFLPLLGVEWSF